MADQANVDLVSDLPNQQGAHTKSEQPGGQAARPRRRIDRNLLLWAAIGFGPPALLIFGLHLTGTPSRTELTVQRDLPAKALLAFFVALATFIVSRIEKRPLSDYGIPLRQAFGLKCWEGMIWAFSILSLIVLVLRAGGFFRVESIGLPKTEFLKWSLAWGATFLAVSLHEEFAFRGYWLFVMSRRMSFWPASLFLSAIFGAAHLGNHGETGIGILQVFGTGMLFCLMIRRTGNLWFAIGYHAAWDWAQTFFYGTPDSGLLGVGRFLNSSVHGPDWLTGGTAGPEGSILSIGALLFCAALIHLRFPSALYPDRPV